MPLKFRATMILAGLVLTSTPALAAKGSPSAAAAAPATATAVATTQPAASSGSTASFESQMLAFQAMDELADGSTKEICPAIDRNAIVVIYDPPTFANMAAYIGFKNNADALRKAYAALAKSQQSNKSVSEGVPLLAGQQGDSTNTKPTKSTSTTMAFAPYTDAVAVLGLLASASNTQTSGSITIPDSALGMRLAHVLGPACSAQKGQVDFVIATVFAQGIPAHDDIGKAIDDLNVEYSKAHIPSPPTAYAAQLTALDGSYAALMTGLSQANPTTGLPLNAQLVQGEQLYQELQSETGSSRPVDVLLATVVAAGGTTQDHKSFWTNLTTGDCFTYSGGLMVGFALWDHTLKNAKYLNVLRKHEGFTSTIRDSDELKATGPDSTK